MKRKYCLLALVLLTGLFLLTGCKVKGNELPDGMDAETVLEQGREIVAMLNDGDWQGVYDRMRADGQATTSPEAIQTYMEAVLDKVGPYVSEQESMTTGQTMKDTGEEYGTAVIYCKHQKKNVMYRIAFSTDMELMGLEAIKK